MVNIQWDHKVFLCCIVISVLCIKMFIDFKTLMIETLNPACPLFILKNSLDYLLFNLSDIFRNRRNQLLIIFLDWQLTSLMYLVCITFLLVVVSVAKTFYLECTYKMLNGDFITNIDQPSYGWIIVALRAVNLPWAVLSEGLYLLSSTVKQLILNGVLILSGTWLIKNT